MPNLLDATGLQTATQTELVTNNTAAFKKIYGADINLSSDTPDGQLMNNFIQQVLDVLNLLTQVYNSFDPDNAFGVVLDQRVTINGIQRQAGTFTITNVTLVITQALNLPGIDQEDLLPYTVSDNAGNLWELQTSQTVSSAGTYVFEFQAATPGANLTVPNTIVVPVSIVLGVQSINNPTSYTTLGINEESDAQLKVRRQKSVSLASQGYLAGLLAALENINGVTSAFVYENDTASTDGNGIPSHSIWVIVAGSASSTDIANAIYQKRNAGAGMFGAINVTITQVDGSPFVVNFDRVTAESLFIKFTVTSLDGVTPPNIAAIRAGLVTLFQPVVNGEVNINQLSTLVQQIDPNTLVTNSGFSTTSGGSYTNTLTPSAKNFQFVVSQPDIIITPMQLVPATSTLVHGTTQTMSGLGGFGTLTYSFVTNNSGGTINSSSGFYTAGATPSTDTLRVADALSNTATATVTVT